MVRAFWFMLLSGATAACGLNDDIDRRDVRRSDSLVLFEDGTTTSKIAHLTSGKVWMTGEEPEPTFVKSPTNSFCGAPKPSPGAKIVHIEGYGTGLDSGLAWLDDHRGTTKVRTIRQSNILVTEETQPVYLFVHSYDGHLWNILKSPGAIIDGITISSYSPSAVAGIDHTHKVGFFQFADSPSEKCQKRIRFADDVALMAKAIEADEATLPPDTLAHHKQVLQESRRDLAWTQTKVGKPDILLYTDVRKPYKNYLVGPAPSGKLNATYREKIIISGTHKPYWATPKAAKAHEKSLQ